MSGTDVGPQAPTDLRALLAARLRAVGQNIDSITTLTRLSGGASRQTWYVEADGPSAAPARFILRRDPPGQTAPTTMDKEALALSASRRHGVPGPDLLDWSTDPSSLGAPYLLMTHVEGETIARRILREDRYAVARPRLARQLGRAAAGIHLVPPVEVADIPAADGLEFVQERYRRVGLRRPVLELAFEWLDRQRPPAIDRPTLVHGDFRLGNVIVDEQGLRAVLDWELVHRGDPMEDLGYLCVRAWRFSGPLPVAGLGAFRELFEGYAEIAGELPDPHRVRWWQVAGTLNWGVSCLVQAHRHLSGETRSVELAAIGRRVAEQEMDLLLMIGKES